jgi:hypothetical protein
MSGARTILRTLTPLLSVVFLLGCGDGIGAGPNTLEQVQRTLVNMVTENKGEADRIRAAYAKFSGRRVTWKRHGLRAEKDQIVTRADLPVGGTGSLSPINGGYSIHFIADNEIRLKVGRDISRAYAQTINKTTQVQFSGVIESCDLEVRGPDEFGYTKYRITVNIKEVKLIEP